MKTNLRLIGGKKLQSPSNIHTRPTTLRVREALFNILSNRVENSNWLDLFSGAGAISCEAYNHGARKIIFKKSLLKSLSAAVDEEVDTKNSLYVTIVIKKLKKVIYGKL